MKNDPVGGGNLYEINTCVLLGSECGVGFIFPGSPGRPITMFSENSCQLQPSYVFLSTYQDVVTLRAYLEIESGQ